MTRLLLVILIGLAPSSALASPVVWAWAGTVTNDTGLNTMPVGTPLQLTYYADSDAANACGAPEAASRGAIAGRREKRAGTAAKSAMRVVISISGNEAASVWNGALSSQSFDYVSRFA